MQFAKKLFAFLFCCLFVSVFSVSVMAAGRASKSPTGVLSSDPLHAPQNQAILAPTTGASLAFMKYTPLVQDQTCKSLALTAVPNSGTLDQIVSGVALYNGTEQLTNFVASVPGSNAVLFSEQDFIKPLALTKDISVYLSVVGNVNAGADGKKLSFLAKISTIGKISGKFTSPAVDLRTNVGSINEGGTYSFAKSILDISKDYSSPTGIVGRGTYRIYAIFDLNSYGTISDIDLTEITFTNKVGLPAGTTPNMYRIVDADTAQTIPASVTVGADSVSFSGIQRGNLQVWAGLTKRVALEITTTSLVSWPSNTAMQWSIASADSIKSYEGTNTVGIGYGGWNYSIPCDANLVSIGS